MKLEVRLPRLRWLSAGALVLVACHFASGAVRIAEGPDVERWTQLFNLDGESNVPTWYGAMLLFFAALAARRRADVADDVLVARGYRRLAAIFVLLSLDEVAMGHERVAAAMMDWSAKHGATPGWVWLVGGVVTAALLGLVVDLLRRIPRPLALRFVAAGAVYVTGALVVEAIGHAWARSHGYWNMTYVALAGLEEAAEMGGVLLFLHRART